MVPLIDVLMVLIIFFLVTMQFRDLRALNVKLPKIDSAGSNLISNELIVSISKEGEFFADAKPITLKKLTALFQATFYLAQETNHFSSCRRKCTSEACHPSGRPLPEKRTRGFSPSGEMTKD
jgi:biopolymer transport protein ExbD